MRFLADMGISQATVKWLRDQGHDAVHLAEEGLSKMLDEDIMVKAAKEERILLTTDLGFGELAHFSTGQRPSVISFRLHHPRSDEINRRLVFILNNFNEPLEQGAILSIQEGRVRVRLYSEP